MKHFYSHLVETESLLEELNSMKLTEREKAHIIGLIDSSIHHAVLDVVLSELTPDEKKVFLEHVATDNHDKVWEHLHTKIEGIEDKIRNTVYALKRDLHKDIKTSQEL